MPNSSIKIINNIYESFIRIYDVWPDKGSEAYARQMLEHDILLLGSYFGAVDPIGQYAEFTLLAECITHLRMVNSAIKTHKITDKWIDRVMDELKGQAKDYRLPVASSNAAEMVAHMKSINLAKDLLERGLILERDKRKLHDNFIDMANMFVMRDGMVTDKEFAAIKEFEKILGDTI